eukprot:2056193-Amphidinium_carterae.3
MFNECRRANHETTRGLEEEIKRQRLDDHASHLQRAVNVAVAKALTPVDEVKRDIQEAAEREQQQLRTSLQDEQKIRQMLAQKDSERAKDIKETRDKILEAKESSAQHAS